MNLLYLKYAVEVAACGSINKAAEKLYIGQPNLSRAIKELETSLGVSIFDRSSKGMEITPDGEVFLGYAKSILRQVDSVEGMFKKGSSTKLKFSISVPRASYIGTAFTSFSKMIGKDDDVKLYYREGGQLDAIRSILQDDYKLGIIRYAETFDRYYKSLLDDKELNYELVSEFKYKLLVSKKSRLTKLEKVTLSDLADFIEVMHADQTTSSPSLPDMKKDDLSEDIDIRRRIYIFERASQFELLSENTDTFMWVSPVPKKLLDSYNLTEIECTGNHKTYKDVIIYRNDYKLSQLDKLFISELCRIRREVFN
ncbi:MAG: LysR family transcriptional regulator [Clostridiales bacterium]|nr:LysR family transcriptional regulator [Clostridiales bacterium]